MRLPARRADRRRDVMRRLLVDVRDADNRTFVREVSCDSLAKPAPGARDQDRLAGKPHYSIPNNFAV